MQKPRLFYLKTIFKGFFFLLPRVNTPRLQSTTRACFNYASGSLTTRPDPIF
jgi:hypothetical protein